MLIYMFISFAVALVGYTYSIILTDAGMILNNWFIFLQRKLESNHEKWFNVLVNCPKCVSGQWALWLFFFTPFFSMSIKSVCLHILFITITIWFSLIINKLHKWLTN